MSDGIPLARRLLEAPAMALGAALTSWSYIWRVTAVARSEDDGSPEDDAPLPLPDDGSAGEGIQRPEDGVGPLLHRRYTGVVEGAGCDAAELMARIAADPNLVAPAALARFRKTRGEPGSIAVGDEFVVRMPGPWDGPIRAVEVTPTSFRFATLDGHLEAGQIFWRAHDDGGRLVFEVDSRSRGGDRFSALLHDRLPMAKEVQLHMWTSVIERVARKSGGRLTDGVRIETRRVDL